LIPGINGAKEMVNDLYVLKICLFLRGRGMGKQMLLFLETKQPIGSKKEQNGSKRAAFVKQSLKA